MNTSKTKPKLQTKQIIYIILTVIFLALISLFLYSIFVPGNFIEELYNSIKGSEAPEFSVMMVDFVLSFFIYTLITLVILWIVELTLRAFKERISKDIENTIRVLIRFVIIIFFIVAYLNKFESFGGAVIGVVATVGAAFGIAASKSLGSTFSGLHLVLSKHHNVDDYLIISDMNIEGVVKEISTSFVTILQPNKTTAVIPTDKLREEEVLNIKIEKFETEKDGITQLFLYGKKVLETHYVYPLKWATHSDDRHSQAVEAIVETGKDFKDFIDDEVDWMISERDRLNRVYLIRLTVLDPKILLHLTSDFTRTLEANYEKIKYPSGKKSASKKSNE
ncbi:MAG: mechanosensitive ion channel [Candidatus Heimdallarchaeota archaeon]|nr:mechanosensitive ion channel [Candidatus Heimdallarchaeota archaeon]